MYNLITRCDISNKRKIYKKKKKQKDGASAVSRFLPIFSSSVLFSNLFPLVSFFSSLADLARIWTARTVRPFHLSCFSPDKRGKVEEEKEKVEERWDVAWERKWGQKRHWRRANSKLDNETKNTSFGCKLYHNEKGKEKKKRNHLDRYTFTRSVISELLSQELCVLKRIKINK